MAATPPNVHPFYEEDPDEEYDDDDDQNDAVPDEDDEEVDVDDDSTSSADPPPSSAVTIAVPGVPSTPEPKQNSESPALTVNAERKPLPLPLEESRKLFQRLWTDEDEIELLQGFLDYTIQRGHNNSSSHHHDTTAFYDMIKCKLQLDFNKNQLVEKLRRLKKKYRNVLSKVNSGKEYVFKTSHDQVTFEISKKIWGNVGAVTRELDEDEGNGNSSLVNVNLNNNLNVALTDDNNVNNVDGNGDCSGKAVKSRKRSRANVKVEEKQIDQSPALAQPQSVAMPPQGVVNTPIGSIPNLIEDTVRSCLSPLFKELLNNAMTGSRGSGMINSMMTNSMMVPLGIGGVSMNVDGGGDVDGKWRKQQILELEVYSKRLELIQDQIKSQLEELRSMGN